MFRFMWSYITHIYTSCNSVVIYNYERLFNLFTSQHIFFLFKLKIYIIEFVQEPVSSSI